MYTVAPIGHILKLIAIVSCRLWSFEILKEDDQRTPPVFKRKHIVLTSQSSLRRYFVV